MNVRCPCELAKVRAFYSPIALTVTLLLLSTTSSDREEQDESFNDDVDLLLATTCTSTHRLQSHLCIQLSQGIRLAPEAQSPLQYAAPSVHVA